MKTKYVHTINGQEVDGSDINLFAEEAAMAGDTALADLIELAPYDGTNVSRGIMPWRPRMLDGSSVPLPPVRDIVTNSGVADGSSRVWPFRAVLGSRTLVATDAEDNQLDICSGYHAGSGGNAYTTVQHAAATNNRFDLIYATLTLDVAGPTHLRAVKNSAGVVLPNNVPTTRVNTVTIGKVQGVEGGIPVRPVIPADTATTFNFPLAYVRLAAGHGVSSQTSRRFGYHEVAPPIARPGETLRPMQWNSTLPLASTSGGVADLYPESSAMPRAYLPPNMCGKEERIFKWRELDHVDGAFAIVDRTIDWRNRFVKITFQILDAASPDPSTDFASQTISGSATAANLVPNASALAPTFVVLGATFGGNGKTLFIGPNQSNLLAGEELQFFPGTNGELTFRQVTPTGTSDRLGVFWFEASAPWALGGNSSSNALP